MRTGKRRKPRQGFVNVNKQISITGKGLILKDLIKFCCDFRYVMQNLWAKSLEVISQFSLVSLD